MLGGAAIRYGLQRTDMDSCVFFFAFTEWKKLCSSTDGLKILPFEHRV